ncbi:NADPH-dependent FMN reductase [Arthrobacter alpinus]|uniref:NADPH-dependent FMN reductase n=1 Tax=Arthrobacter alpinus TaxID=656366 RepID=A0A0S2M2R9_9MICC|nr:NADPH-dependent FMN reductase [Arthrobacter alpinus]
MNLGAIMQRTVVVISAGLGVPSSTRMLADQISADVQQRLSAAGADPIIDVIDLRDYATDIANNMVSGYAGPALAEVIKRVEAADAMIAVTPTFSASYSGLFKSFFDVLDPKFLDGMPVVFGATGGSSRHSLVLDMAIRPLFSYLRAHTMPTAIYASPEDWGGSGTNTLERRIGQAAAELTTVLMGQQGSATGASGAVLIDHKAKRAQREVSDMTSLPFAELLAQTQRR